MQVYETVENYHKESYDHVRVRQKESEWFHVRVGLRQGFMMIPWLFSIYLNGVVRGVNVRKLPWGVRMQDMSGR